MSSRPGYFFLRAVVLVVYINESSSYLSLTVPTMVKSRLDPTRTTFERIKRQKWARKDWVVSSPSEGNKVTLGTNYQSFPYLLP